MKPEGPLKRLQVVIAELGIASRRAAEILIQEGHVRVNGLVVSKQGLKVNPEVDRIEVKGKLISLSAQAKHYYLFHKPLGVTTTLRDPHAKRIIADYFKNIPVRLFPAGRLDQDSTGLLLMTNDGELVHRLTHPRYGIKKHYQVRVDRKLSPAQLDQFRKGLELEGKRTAPCEIHFLSSDSEGKAEYEVILHEGKKRQIRLMMKKIGAQVICLRREKYGPLSLGDLKPGEKRPLSADEIKMLKKEVFK